MAQTSVISQKAVVSLTRAVEFGTSKLPITIGSDTSLSSGTAAGSADTVYAEEAYSIAASGSQNFDLSGSLTDPLGGAAVFVKVDAIVVKAASTNTNNVLLGGAASNGFVGPFADATDILAIKPGGQVTLYAGSAGWGVTAGTGDILKVANSGSGTAVVFDMVIIGRSA